MLFILDLKQKSIDLELAIKTIKGYVRLSAHSSKKDMPSNMIDFSILKLFDIQTRPRKATRTLQVIWNIPVVGWIKINTDGTTRGSPRHSACGGIFGGSQGGYI